MTNVAAHLESMARQQPDALAVAVANRTGGYDRLDCAGLNRRCDRVAHALESVGIGPGVRTVLMVPPSLEFFALTFALFKIGAVPVMVDPGMGLANLGKCLAQAQPEAFIGIPKAHVARLLFGWCRKSFRMNVTVGRRLGWGGASLASIEREAPDRPYQMPAATEDQLAAILFTSGSTGVPKGVEYTHGIFAAQVRQLRDVYGIRPGERDLSTFPLFALFGPALGMASIVPLMDTSRPVDADPAKLVSAIEDFECTTMFASPALLGVLGRHCAAHDITLKTLNRAISAGAPVPGTTVACFSGVLAEGAELFTGYGATEAMPVASIGSADILKLTRNKTDAGAGVCVGRPVAGIDVAIVPISDEPIDSWSDDLALPAGEIGEIVVHGPVVTARYFGRVEATRLAKIQDPQSGIVRHRMGDLGYLDADGRLWMCGRKSHRVQTNGGDLYTVPCEALFNTHEHVFRSALVGVKLNGTMEPVICIELEDDRGAVDRDVLTRELLSIGPSNAITHVLYHPGFPVDVRHNAKIFREKLAIWAAKQLS